MKIRYTLSILNLCFVASARSPQSCTLCAFLGIRSLGALPKFKLVRVYLLILGLLSLSTAAIAYEKWYKVEVLIFETKDKNALTENWPLEPGKPATKNSVELLVTPNTEFSLLNNKQLMLNDAKRKIQNNYRIVLHQGWRQVLSEKENAQSVHLFGGKQYPHSQGAQISADSGLQDPSAQYEIDGTFRFSGGKFLHMDTDLLFRKPVTILSLTSSNPKATFSEISGQDWQNMPNAKLQTFRLKESVRLRMDEVHYIDHPLYGVIIMVSKEKSEI